MLDEFRRLALFTSGVAELTRHRAEQLVRDMVQSGEVRRDQASSLVKTVLDLGNQNRRELGQMIRSEIRNQISSLGVATERDLERLERRVARIEERQRSGSQEGPLEKTTAKSPKKTTRGSKKTTARKKTTTAKTSASGRSSARVPTRSTTAIDSTPSSGAGDPSASPPSDSPRP